MAETSFSPLAVKQDLNHWTDWEEPDDLTASISIDYVDAVSPIFAGWVLDSWKRTDEVENGIPWQEASRPGLDRLYAYIEVPEGPAEYDVGDHHYTVNQFADTYYWLGQAGDQVFRHHGAYQVQRRSAGGADGRSLISISASLAFPFTLLLRRILP